MCKYEIKEHFTDFGTSVHVSNFKTFSIKSQLKQFMYMNNSG